MIAENTNPIDRLLRKWVVAKLLGCSLRTVEREAQEGRLTRIKVRGCVCFRESEVMKIINGRSNDLQS